MALLNCLGIPHVINKLMFNGIYVESRDIKIV